MTEQELLQVPEELRETFRILDAQTARKYWNRLKQRLKEEGNETVTNCHQLKLRAADGNILDVNADPRDLNALESLLKTMNGTKN